MTTAKQREVARMETDRTAREISEREAKARALKTSRLRELRLKREQDDKTNCSPTKKARKQS
jgi:hypothetical protein